jgi:hypothetical protein
LEFFHVPALPACSHIFPRIFYCSLFSWPVLLSVTVPANTRAAVYLPKLATEAFAVTESGKPLWPAIAPASAPGVIAVTEEDASIKCLVGVGAYRFRETPCR